MGFSLISPVDIERPVLVAVLSLDSVGAIHAIPESSFKGGGAWKGIFINVLTECSMYFVPGRIVRVERKCSSR